MKTKTIILSAVIVIALAIGITAYAHGPGGDSRGGFGMGGNEYAMMGGGGMMSGYGAGQGMMDWYGRSDRNQYGRDTRDRDRWSPRTYGQDRPNSRTAIESLRNQIQEKRRELSSLFRSDNADKTLMERKVEELDNLERYLDQKISSRDT
ncbi:MAG: hypothetical protein HQ552_11335, partial [Desulfobacteraceae bacterium]|nr:hypothetical protein [Desulfobacteraceae bacterium]